tara:strand:- start:7394 stop:8083 length:690 start_codon:yes stop_codon:yes gene_type:complete
MLRELSELREQLLRLGEKTCSSKIDVMLKEVFAAQRCTNKNGWRCLEGFDYISWHGSGKTVVFGDSQVGGALGLQFKGIRYLSNSSTVPNWISWFGAGFGDHLKDAQNIYILLGGNGYGEEGVTMSSHAKELLKMVERSNASANIVWITPAPPAQGYGSERIMDRQKSSQNISEALSNSDDRVRVVDSHSVVTEHYNGDSWKCPSGHCDGIHLKGDVAKVLADRAKSQP